MTTLQVDDDGSHDERLAAEIVRLRQELEHTVYVSQPLSDATLEGSDETQPPVRQQPKIMDHLVDDSLSSRGNLFRTTSQTEYVDSSACYKYADSDEDGDVSEMLSYDEVTVDTTDEQFLFMVEDEVTVLEEDEIDDVAGVTQSRAPMKRVPSLQDHILSYSQHKPKATLNPYDKYTATMHDEDSAKSDTFHNDDDDDNNNETSVEEEEDNQSCLSYDEITVTTADLMAEIEQHNEPWQMSSPNILDLNISANSHEITQNNSTDSLDDVIEDEVAMPTQRNLIEVSATTDVGIVPGNDDAKATHDDGMSASQKECVVGDDIVKEVLNNDIHLDIVQSGSIETVVAVDRVPELTPTLTLDTKGISIPVKSSLDSAWTTFGQHLIDTTKEQSDDLDALPDVQTKSFESSFTNTVDSKNYAVEDAIVGNNTSISRNLSIDEQIRLMQEEMLMSSPTKFQSAPHVMVPKKVADSSVQSLGHLPTLQSSAQNPLSAAASPITLSRTDLLSSEGSPNGTKTPRNRKAKSPKLICDISRRRNSKSPLKTQPTQQHNSLPALPNALPLSPGMNATAQSPRQHTEPVQKQQSPSKSEPPSQHQNLAVSAQQSTKSPFVSLSSLMPLNSLLPPGKKLQSPKSKMQQSPNKNKVGMCADLPPIVHPHVSPTTESHQQKHDITASNVEPDISRDTSEPVNTKKKKTKMVRKIRKKTAYIGDLDQDSIGVADGAELLGVVDQEASDLQAQIDEMQAQIAALASSTTPTRIHPSEKENLTAKNENRPPPMMSLLGAIESAASKRVKRLEDTDGELLMQNVTPEVDAKSPKNPQLSTSMAEMISQRAAARDKRLADGGEQRMRKVVIKEKDEYKKDFSSIVGDAAAMGRLTRLNEYTVEAVGLPKKPQEEWKSNGLLAIQWKSSHMSVIHDAAAAGNATKMREHTVSNFQEENQEHDLAGQLKSTRMEKLLLVDKKVGEGLRKIDNFILGQKEYQGKVNSLLIKPMQSYSKVEDVKLPRQSVPIVDPVKNAEKLSKMKRDALLSGRPMIDISASAAERAWERRARLDRPGTAPNVRQVCPCPYCLSASPYQTFAYRELERKQKEEGLVDPQRGRKKRNDRLHCIEHQDTRSTDSDVAQAKSKEEEDEIELKRLERQRVREERRKLKQAVADAETAIADAETAALLKKQLEHQKQNDDASYVPTTEFHESKKSTPMESAPIETSYSMVKERADDWNNQTTAASTSVFNPKYKNPSPPTIDSAKCRCIIM